MEEKRMPRVLVSTVAQWSDIGADTWSLLLSKYDVSSVASLYIRAAKSKSPMCHRYFHIFEDRVMKSIFSPAIKTGEEYFYVSGETDDDLDSRKDEENEAKRYSLCKKHSNWLLYVAREFVWKFGHWKSKELNTFLDDFDPEVLVFPIESYIHLNRINKYIIKKKHPKVIGFFNDDNFSYKQGKGFGFAVRRFWLRRSVKWLVDHCDTVFAVCPKTKRECDAEFGIDSIVLSKPMGWAGDFDYKELNEPFRIVYTGKLYINRDRTIASIAEVIHRVNCDRPHFRMDIYTTSTLSESMRKAIECDDYCKVHGPIPYSQVCEEQKNSDILLFVEDLSDENLAARLSFSTKITDYFGSGRCIWAVGNSDLAPIEYLKEMDAGLVSTNDEEILSALNAIIYNPCLLNEYAEKGYRCGQENHGVDRLTAIFMNAIMD